MLNEKYVSSSRGTFRIYMNQKKTNYSGQPGIRFARACILPCEERPLVRMASKNIHTSNKQ